MVDLLKFATAEEWGPGGCSWEGSRWDPLWESDRESRAVDWMMAAGAQSMMVEEAWRRALEEAGEGMRRGRWWSGRWCLRDLANAGVG